MLDYKKLANYCFLLFTCLFLACSEDNKEGIYDSQIELAITRINSGEVFFQLDNGKTILPDRKINYDLEDNRRVRILFSVIKENSDSFDAIATIHSLGLVSVSPVKQLTPEGELLPENDPLGVESIWIGSHYLNFSFYIYADSKEHRVNLVQIKSIENDTAYFEIRHSANNDFPAYRKKGIISFDIKALENHKPATLAITANTYDGEKTYYRAYD